MITMTTAKEATFIIGALETCGFGTEDLGFIPTDDS